MFSHIRMKEAGESLDRRCFECERESSPPAGREWCGPRTARGGERSVYGTGAALRPGAPSVGGGAIGELGAGNDGGGAGGERQEGRSQGAGDPTQQPTDPFVNRWTNPHGLPRAH